jgi:hypothetical protein
VATELGHGALVANGRTCGDCALEQRLLEAADRHERERRLAGERPQIAGAIRHAAQTDHVAADGASGREIALAARREQRHQPRVEHVEPEAREVSEVTRAGDQELRAQLGIARRRRAAVDDERREPLARELARDREPDRARADDRDVVGRGQGITPSS